MIKIPWYAKLILFFKKSHATWDIETVSSDFRNHILYTQFKVLFGKIYIIKVGKIKQHGTTTGRFNGSVKHQSSLPREGCTLNESINRYRNH